MSKYTLHGDVAVITMNNPPMNTMSHANRTAVRDGVDAANADAAVKAIVITGGGKVFSSGAEIKEFNTPAATASPALGEVMDVDTMGGLALRVNESVPAVGE